MVLYFFILFATAQQQFMVSILIVLYQIVHRAKAANVLYVPC